MISMSYKEMKKTIIFYHHKNIDYWYKLVGKMFEITNSFTKYGEIKLNLNGKKCCIIWNNYNQDIKNGI